MPRTLRGWLGLIAGLFFAIILFILLLLFTTPGWYHPADSSSQAVIDTSEITQNRLLDLHNTLERAKARASTWVITQDQVNALLAVDPSITSAASRGRVFQPAVRFTPGTIEIGARVAGIPSLDSHGGVVTLRLLVESLSNQDPPQVRISIDALFINSLRIFRSALTSKLDEAAPLITSAVRGSLSSLPNAQEADIDRIVRSLIRGEPFPTRFVYRHRTLQVQDIRVEQGQLTLTVAPAEPLK